MNRYDDLTIYSVLIIVVGLILSVLSFFPSEYIRYAVGIGILASAAFAFLTAYKSKDLQIPLKYHALHGIAMAIYGLAVLFYATDKDKFLHITTFFFLYYGIAETIFSLQILLMRLKNLNLNIVLTRLALGFVIALGAIMVLNIANVNENDNDKWAYFAAGIIFIFSGVNLILFKVILHRLGDVV